MTDAGIDLSELELTQGTQADCMSCLIPQAKKWMKDAMKCLGEEAEIVTVSELRDLRDENQQLKQMKEDSTVEVKELHEKLQKEVAMRAQDVKSSSEVESGLRAQLWNEKEVRSQHVKSSLEVESGFRAQLWNEKDLRDRQGERLSGEVKTLREQLRKAEEGLRQKQAWWWEERRVKAQSHQVILDELSSQLNQYVLERSRGFEEQLEAGTKMRREFIDVREKLSQKKAEIALCQLLLETAQKHMKLAMYCEIWMQRGIEKDTKEMATDVYTECVEILPEHRTAEDLYSALCAGEVHDGADAHSASDLVSQGILTGIDTVLSTVSLLFGLWLRLSGRHIM